MRDILGSCVVSYRLGPAHLNFLLSPMPDDSSPPSETRTPSFGVTMRIVLPSELGNRPKDVPGRQGGNVTEPISRVISSRASASKSGADFQQLLQNLYDSAFITDQEGEILMANPRADSAFQAEFGQLCHTNILTLICGADESLLESIRDTLKSNRFVLMQAYCRRVDGTIFPTEISVNPLQLEGQDRMSFFMRDVTLRKEREEKLSAGNTAIQNSSSGIAIADIRGRIEFCNPAFANFFGLPDTATAAGLDLRELIRAPGRIDEILEQTARGQTWEGDFELERADDDLFHAQASIIANLDADGKPAGIVVSVLDTTSQKKAQRQLEEFAATLRLRNSQMQEEMDMAGELQVALLPAKFRVLPSGADEAGTLLHLHHLYCPNGRIGGDFCHIRELSETEASLFIVDVMGHGVRSALVVATIRGLLEELRPLARDPGALLTQLNKNFTTIFRRLGVDMTFATAFYAVMDTQTGELKYANASHPAPYLLRPHGTEIHQLKSSEGQSAALGILEDARFATSGIMLKPDDRLLLYTDGLAEAQSATGEFFMDRRMDEVIHDNAGQSPTILLEALLGEARSFSGLETLEDDVCLVAMQVIRLAEES
jgi:phosphoserine phosphatase RsbU/P